MNTKSALTKFVIDLLGEGRVKTRGRIHLHQASQADRESASMVLVGSAVIAADEVPGVAPAFVLPAALWAAEAFAWACGMLIDRAEVETNIPPWIIKSRPATNDLSSHWSVDLVFRFAYDLIKRSESISPNDDLHAQLLELFTPWPVSAVGLHHEPPQAESNLVLTHSTLRQMLVDRTLLRQDKHWLQDSRIKHDIEVVLGGYPELFT
ncbi:hypothetical protein [Rhodopirellula sp. MGV]|uniref:hypothetical protein n=1 Tax=Rhodopirellula sp. MGV TaxID=2023130 RepID=UPI000B9724A0|nr:hypothetical protein [Rhodopirellula sp. MGV]OYP36360.1 hypothetical protein CGZ80_08585 [Rhodopirellula sp. MGV]PNY38408.1 hypothetical protein C2E31_00195 [Rhodopirellula baltica]